MLTQLHRGFAIPDRQLRHRPQLLQRRQQYFFRIFVCFPFFYRLLVICIGIHPPKQLCFRRSISKQQCHWNLQPPDIHNFLHPVLLHLCQDDIICHQVYDFHKDSYQDAHHIRQWLSHQVLRSLHYDHRLPYCPIQSPHLPANGNHHQVRPQGLLRRSKWRKLRLQASHHRRPLLQLDIRILQAKDRLHHGHRVLEIRLI